MPPSSATATLSGTGKAQEPQPGPLNLYDAASLHKALEEATREVSLQPVLAVGSFLIADDFPCRLLWIMASLRT